MEKKGDEQWEEGSGRIVGKQLTKNKKCLAKRRSERGMKCQTSGFLLLSFLLKGKKSRSDSNSCLLFGFYFFSFPVIVVYIFRILNEFMFC